MHRKQPVTLTGKSRKLTGQVYVPLRTPKLDRIAHCSNYIIVRNRDIQESWSEAFSEAVDYTFSQAGTNKTTRKYNGLQDRFDYRKPDRT